MAGRKKKTAKARWTRREYLEDALSQYEKMAADAEGAGSYQAACRAKMQAVQTRSEIDQIDEAEKVMTIPSSVEDHQREIIQLVRRLRASADASKSYGPAATFLQLEAELVQAEADRQAAPLVATELEYIRHYIVIKIRGYSVNCGMPIGSR